MQTGQNIQTAIGNAWLNNTNQKTPFGSLTYKPVGYQEIGGGYSVPQFEAVQTLSPQQQKLFDTQQAVSQGTSDLAKAYTERIGQATATPFSYEGLPAAPQYDENFRQQQTGKILERAQPQLDQERRALEQRLADQGISLGQAGYDTAMRNYNTSLNDFRLAADLQGGDEAARMFGLQGDARTRAVQERLLERSQPINEVSALLGTGPGVQMPQFVNTPQNGTMQAPDIASQVHNSYAGQLQNAQTQQQSASATQGGLFGLGGAALMAGAMFL